MWKALKEIAQLIRVLFTDTSFLIKQRKKQNEKAIRIADADNTVDRMRHFDGDNADGDK